MKSPVREADAFWSMLAEGGCRPIVDRDEMSWALNPAEVTPAPASAGARVRRARVADLMTLVIAARASVAALRRAAFASGADHVQLAVVAGNRAAEALYRGLGFRPFAGLRTVLFEAPQA
jgi:hypothetical protein